MGGWIMLLKKKNAVVYGAGGAVGSAVARAFAREGARVFLAGRTLSPLHAVAGDISGAGGVADTAQVDALDEKAVERHASAVAAKVGGIDIAFNAVGFPVPKGKKGQGLPLLDMPIDDFIFFPANWSRTQLVTARAAARHMIQRGSGVILTLTATPARQAFPLVGGFATACAAVEALFRTLAAELGPHGVRVVCLRSTGSPEAPGVRDTLELHARAQGVTRDEFQAQLEGQTLLRRLTTLGEVGSAAALMASDRASAITGAVANVSCGAVVD
jgi:NAD(P)-dependent dehydrogenase (short-subunit alcohol dehydrogenase family)